MHTPTQALPIKAKGCVHVSLRQIAHLQIPFDRQLVVSVVAKFWSVVSGGDPTTACRIDPRSIE